MKVIFRVDSATHMGGGHLMRCLSLAEALRDHSVHIRFICRELSGNLISLLQSKGFSVSVLPPPLVNQIKPTDDYGAWLGVSQAEDASQTLEALGDERPEWLVVDHYGLGVVWEEALRSYCDRIMVIEDLANRHHDCDVLVDQNYSLLSKLRYNSLVPKTCQVLLGPSYALLRKEFQLLRQHQISISSTLKQLLVFFTTGDDQGETLKAMNGIAIFGKSVQVDVVIGNANSDALSIQALCTEKNWTYHCQVDYMPSLIAKADLVIGAGGSSNWERCALGVPALVSVLAENQSLIAQALDSAGVVYNLGKSCCLQASDYTNALNELNHARLSSMSEKAHALVDAKGHERVAAILIAA